MSATVIGRSRHPASDDTCAPGRMPKCGERRDAQEPPSMHGAYSADTDASEPLSRQAFKFALVLGLHGVLVTWLAYNAAQLRETQINSIAEPAPCMDAQVSSEAGCRERPPITLDVRMINMPPPETPRPVTEPPRPLPQTPQPVVRQTESITPAPVLTTAPNVNQDADPAPVAFSVSPQPPAPQPVALPAPSVDVAVTEARFDADYLQNPAPAYPALSRRLREEGTVLLLVRVTAKGNAEQVQIKQSSGFARLDEAALNAVRQWRFVPARRGEEPIAASVVVPIVFRLSD